MLLARHHENPYSNSFHRNSFLPSGSRTQLASRLVALPCQSASRVRKLGHRLIVPTHHCYHACSHNASKHVSAHSLHLMCLPTGSGGQPEDTPAMCLVPCEAGDLGVAPLSQGHRANLAQLAELNSMGAILVGSPVLHNTRSMA